MPVKLRQFVQDEWITSGVSRYAQRGDFADLSGLAPSHSQRKLERAPNWSALTGHANLINVQAIFLDAGNGRHVLIGKADDASDLESGYYPVPVPGASFSWTGPYTLITGVSTLGGLSIQNVAYNAGKLYLIDGTNNHVYRSIGYVSSMGSAFWNDSNEASILVPFGARLYMLTDKGVIWRINDGDTAFETYLAPTEDFTPLYATPFKGYLLVVALHDDGRLSLYRVSIPSATYFQELATIYNLRVTLPAAGRLFAVHDDMLFFSPGPQHLGAGIQEHTAEVFTYNGSILEKHCEFLVDTALDSGSAGFLTWQSKLIYYVLTGTSPRFYALTGKNFTTYAPATMDFSGLTTAPIANGSDNSIIVTAGNGSQGIHYAEFYYRQDGHLITARMDFGHPGRQKRLERITAIIDRAIADFDVIIKYRIDDTAGWTTLVTADNTQTITAGSIGVDFYTLQIRVDLDDDTAANQDIAIEAVSVLYTEPE